MFRRGTMFYCEDRTTGQQKSLLTKDETEASKIVQAKNDAVNQPLMNLVMAKRILRPKTPNWLRALGLMSWCDFATVTKSRRASGTSALSAPRNDSWHYSSVSFKNLSISEAGMSLWRSADELWSKPRFRSRWTVM
jgi:hypothetical protein